MRLLLGVDELKNASQLVVISAIAEEEPPLEVAVADAVLEAGAAADDVAGGVLLLELGLLEHAATAVANARPSAGASKIRRAMCWNRILCASLVRVGFGPFTYSGPIVYPAAGKRLAIADVRVSSAPAAGSGGCDASRETCG
jgi:hypothetical protein